MTKEKRRRISVDKKVVEGLIEADRSSLLQLRPNSPIGIAKLLDTFQKRHEAGISDQIDLPEFVVNRMLRKG